jgi:superfamily I DNA/RNA helicase
MSIDLAIANPISGTPQPIQDQNNNNSALYISQSSTSMPSTAKLVFGIGQSGYGEWIQNTFSAAQTYGISLFVNSIEQLRLTNTHVTLPHLVAGSGTDLVADSNGNIFTQSSSARHKENIAEFKDDFAKVLAIEPVSFRYRDSGHESVGYLAEDLHEKGLGSLVSYDDEGLPFSINYKLLPVYLLELLKSQQAMIEQLQVRVAAMTPA